MLKVGDKAPEFQAESSLGGSLSSADLNGKVYVLYFYPKSFTSGCTVETRRFAEMTPEIEALGAQIVGISIDSVDTQSKFSDEVGVDFPILADVKGDIAKAFGSKWALLPLAKRVTYVVDEEGRVEAVFASERKFEEHVDHIVAHLKKRS